MTIREFKRSLNNIFDDNLHTKQWQNWIDYAIIGLIIISTLEVFVSTFEADLLTLDGAEKYYVPILHYIDIITTAIFTIEITLRIWCADLLDDKYKGFFGRIRYCFSFYGLIDILSTYPYIIYIICVNHGVISTDETFTYNVLKGLRIVRLLHVFRYMYSFRLLSKTIRSKKSELWASIQFLLIITIILSLILAFVEPEVYANGWDSVKWAFLKYIGDPGGYANNPPMTTAGKIIAVLVGILAIAIIAVPAGLLSSGLIEVMQEESKGAERKSNIEKITATFRQVECCLTKYLIVPKYVSVVDIQAQQGISQADIIDAVEASDYLRMRNIATARPITERIEDKLVVECFPKNRPYGCCVDRGAKVTIVSTSSCSEAAIGHFSFYLAMIGGFNYVSKEVELDKKNPVAYYNIDDRNLCPNLPLFLNDIDRLANRDESWVIFLVSASGVHEPVYPTHFHYVVGAAKGDETYEDPNITINDVATFDAMYNELTDTIRTQFGFDSDRQRYHDGSSPSNICRHICCGQKINAFTIRIAFDVTCWDYHNTLISKVMADTFNKYFEPDVQKEYTEELTARKPKMDCGYGHYTLASRKK